MARAKRLTTLAVTVLVFGGCGGAAATPTGSSASPQHSSVASPALGSAPAASASPTLALTALASTYSAASDKGNAALVQCDKAKAVIGGSLDKAKAAAQQCLAGYTAYVADLRAVDWGPTQPKVDAVIAAMDKIDTLVGQMANASSETVFTAEYQQLAPAEVALLGAANSLRSALGLPPVKP
jgi:hypothetical protein